VHVDPIKPTLKAPGTKRLKLKHDKLLPNFAFNCNLRRYNKGTGFVLFDASTVGQRRLTPNVRSRPRA
jgi:hypothetical protein